MGKKNKRHHKSETSQEVDKPLKLVLKVDPADAPDVVEPTEQVEDGERKHRHTKKKKRHSTDKHKHHHEHHSDRKEKRKRESDVAAESERGVVELDEEPVPKRAAIEDTQTHTQTKPSPETVVRCENNTARLHTALSYIHKTLQRKDSNGIFLYPVTDSIAPGYSDIIEQAMDFSTMKTKVDNNKYTNIADYRRDFKLMCDNCMTYNHPDTVFYKEGRKLLTSGLKLTTKDKLKNHTVPVLTHITSDDFGPEEYSLADIDQLDEEMTKSGITRTGSGQGGSASGAASEMAVDLVQTDPIGEDLLAEVEDAASEAADRLAERNPRGKMAYLEKLKNGRTVLNFLNPDNDGIVEEQKRVISLGGLIGKLQTGTGSIAGFKEDKRNKATPVHYLTYGPFSSYGPMYDSSAANFTKEESDLLLSTYGDETGAQYAKSLRSFVADADNYAIKMVDNLLDVLTNGEHSKTLKYLQASEEEQIEQPPVPEKPSSEPAVNFDTLRSLSSLGIDMSFLDAFEKHAKTDTIQTQLDTTSRLLGSLQTAQQERLGEKTPQHLAYIPGPSDKEIKIAEQLQKGIAVLVKLAHPGDVIGSSTLKTCVRESSGPALEDAADKSSEATPEEDSADKPPTDAPKEDTTNKAPEAAPDGCNAGVKPAEENTSMDATKASA